MKIKNRNALILWDFKFRWILSSKMFLYFCWILNFLSFKEIIIKKKKIFCYWS